jgi:hypothetical protein
LGALQRLLGVRRGVDGKDAAAAGLKQPDQRQPGDGDRHDDLEQGEAGIRG